MSTTASQGRRFSFESAPTPSLTKPAPHGAAPHPTAPHMTIQEEINGIGLCLKEGVIDDVHNLEKVVHVADPFTHAVADVIHKHEHDLDPIKSAIAHGMEEDVHALQNSVKFIGQVMTGHGPVQKHDEKHPQVPPVTSILQKGVENDLHSLEAATHFVGDAIAHALHLDHKEPVHEDKGAHVQPPVGRRGSR